MKKTQIPNPNQRTINKKQMPHTQKYKPHDIQSTKSKVTSQELDQLPPFGDPTSAKFYASYHNIKVVLKLFVYLCQVLNIRIELEHREKIEHLQVREFKRLFYASTFNYTPSQIVNDIYERLIEFRFLHKEISLFETPHPGIKSLLRLTSGKDSKSFKKCVGFVVDRVSTRYFFQKIV